MKCKVLPNSLVPSALDARLVSGSNLTAVRQESQAEADAHAVVFAIDLAGLSDNALSDGIQIAPVLEAASATSAKPQLWTPSLGRSVTYIETWPALLRDADADMSVTYLRFDELTDWKNWQLHVWTEAGEEHAGQSAVVVAEPPLRRGAIKFDLARFIVAYGATVYAEPVRMRDFERGGENGVVETVREADRRDLVRKWTVGEFSNAVYIVQGDACVREFPALLGDMDRQRWFRLRYRRHLAGDYRDWDLWTWDDRDPCSHRVPVQPVQGSATRAWVDFMVDRAAYGAGASVSFVPRQGGADWIDRDDPVRTWTADMLDETGMEVVAESGESVAPQEGDSSVPTFLIAQGTAHVFRRLSEAKAMLTAFVDSEHSITVRTPVPVSWISPPRKGCVNAVAETVVKHCEQLGATILCKGGHFEDCTGSLLRFRKVKQRSSTESRLMFDKAIVTFEEDFLVENVLVSVPGFDCVTLTWKICRDWDEYLYDGTLGWDYQPEKCSFRCFAPTADRVSVVLYDTPDGTAGRRVIPMRRIPEGCWKAIVRGDIKGMYYKLLAEGENERLFPGVEVIDPYSRCNTGHAGRGLIFGTETTPIHPRPDILPHETIIYELHIRDVTIEKSAGIRNRGKFRGLTERGTALKNNLKCSQVTPLTPWEQQEMPLIDQTMQTLSKFSTGLDHIVQMGVNAIQVLPIQDFDNDEEDEMAYRWGYMPVHFNSPDGWYASSTTSVNRVTEFKQLVDAVHRAGLKVIMDVVYNHTAEDVNEFNLDARFSFNGLAPRYYYRTCGNTPVAHTGDSTCGRRKPDEPRCGECYSNGSGCGNEFRSESPMGRKFIIDSLKYWVTEYKVDGFRFDLLGLIDVDTLEKASAELHAIDSKIMIYGEPWIGGLSPIRITEKGMQRSKGFGVFNNTFRDAIRGSPFDIEETFVMDGGRLTDVKGGIIGSVDSFCDKPLETINYVECHDNYTLWDHMRFYIRLRTDEIAFTESDMRRMHRLAAALVFTSQGIPFMQAGQEMCRTKFDVENSYESPDEINMIRWGAKESEWTTVQYYRGLILLRRSHPEIFCKQTADEIHDSVVFYEDLGLPVPDRCIAYRILGDQERLRLRLQSLYSDADQDFLTAESSKWIAVVVLFNPTPSEVAFELPGREKDDIWIQVVDAITAGTRPIRQPITGSIDVQGRSASVLRKCSTKEEIDLRLAQRLAAISDSYCSFYGDDLLSRYAVGLEKEMRPQELEAKRDLVIRRQQFEKNRIAGEHGHLFVPSRTLTERSAIDALNKLHGKATATSSSDPSGQ